MCFIRDADKLCTCVFYVAKFVKKNASIVKIQCTSTYMCTMLKTH